MDDEQPRIDSELLDLTGLSLIEIMQLDGPAMQRSLARVMREINAGPEVIVCGNWSEGEAAPDRTL